MTLLLVGERCFNCKSWVCVLTVTLVTDVDGFLSWNEKSCELCARVREF